MTRQFLLEGSHYVLVHCGLLLRGTALLQNSGDHSAAIGLAALAYEEIGRCRILKEKRKALVQGVECFCEAASKSVRGLSEETELGDGERCVSFLQKVQVGSVVGGKGSTIIWKRSIGGLVKYQIGVVYGRKVIEQAIMK